MRWAGVSGSSKLCEKKQLIIDKFDELLKKLGGEELSANITMGKVSKEWKEAMTVSTILLDLLCSLVVQKSN